MEKQPGESLLPNGIHYKRNAVNYIKGLTILNSSRIPQKHHPQGRWNGKKKARKVTGQRGWEKLTNISGRVIQVPFLKAQRNFFGRITVGGERPER